MNRLCLLFAGLTVLGFVFAQTASAALTNRYVVKNNASAAVPYDAPANAAGDIQTAINYAKNNETVLVYAATYDLGGTKVGYLTNRVYISKAITVRSIDNNPATTIIKGAWDPVTTNGWLAIRCVYMVDGASLVGFTLTNGATISTNVVIASSIGSSASGGGLWAQSTSATISNCVIAGNTAFGDHWNGYAGGGAFQGTFFNCIFTGNSVPYSGGGGAHYAVLSNCTLSGNSTAGAGGGAYRGILYGCLVSNNNSSLGYGGGIAGYNGANPILAYDCTIVSNRVSGLTASYGGGAYCAVLSNCTVNFNRAAGAANTGRGGGAYGSTMINCQVVSNYTDYWGGGACGCAMTKCTLAYNVGGWGGGAKDGALYNCLIYGNQASDAGGVYASTLYNCTVVGNYATHYGGGMANFGPNVNVINSIIYSNQAAVASYPNWAATSGGMLSFTNSCTFPANGAGWAGSSTNNTTNDPRFIAYGAGYGANHVPGNYRLQANSPCMDTGTNQDWMTNAVDLNGRIRIRYGIVDMGAYEASYSGPVIILR